MNPLIENRTLDKTLLPVTSQKRLDVFEAIQGRRSVRAFTGETVSKEAVQLLLRLAVAAPSAVNRQPWAFVVIQNRKILDEISEEAKRAVATTSSFVVDTDTHFRELLSRHDFDIFYGASTLVVICAQADSLESFPSESDCFLAGENLMLAAHGLGLGSCPIGFARDVVKTSRWKAALEIPADYSPVLPIALGHPAEVPAPVKRKPPLIFDWL